jgi:hypothetical protein
MTPFLVIHPQAFALPKIIRCCDPIFPCKSTKQSGWYGNPITDGEKCFTNRAAPDSRPMTTFSQTPALDTLPASV